MTKIFDLTGKTAIITGASGGLWKQFARTLQAAGARVILASASRYVTGATFTIDGGISWGGP